MSFGQPPFLAFYDQSSSTELLSAVSRVAPYLIPASLSKIIPTLPPRSEYYIYHDSTLTTEEIYSFLDQGAIKFISKDEEVLTRLQVPPTRLGLEISDSNMSKDILRLVSTVLLTTSSFTQDSLIPIREALNAAPTSSGRPHDFFILARNTSIENVLSQPASLKLLSRSVSAINALPLSLLSVEIPKTLSIPAASNGKIPVASLVVSSLRSDRPDGLIPTVPVSVASIQSLLGLVYSSEESVAHAILSGNATYHSRSRNGLWKKGETSGAMQVIDRIRMDCDFDALEFQVLESGPKGEKDGFCHVAEQTSCFGPISGLSLLESTLKSRLESAPPGSYTARLFSEPALVNAKIMEEAKELCEAQTKEEIASEMADLLYFSLARCVAAGVGLGDVAKVLDKRSLKITRRKGDAKKEWAEKLGLNENQTKGVAGGAPASVSAPAVPPPSQPASTANDLIQCKTVDLSSTTAQERALLLKRPHISSSNIMSLVNPILKTVREEDDTGLRSLVAKFDRCKPAESSDFELLLKAPFKAQDMVLDPKVKAAIDQAYSNIRVFHQAQMDKERGAMVIETMPGVVCSRFARPIQRVGVYVPGGTAILPSTALMLAVPAQVANCESITLATPPRPDGTISPEIVYIASITGVSGILRAGGAHAIAALAYGTTSTPKVDKIFGPGNQFVTAAKMAVSMDSSSSTAIDMPAGPSEVLVIADKTSVPAFVASDLLAQAEHGVDSQVVLLTVDLPSAQLEEIEREIHVQALALSRVDIIRKSIALSLIIKCKDIEEAMEFSNGYAPEHLILHTENPSGLLDKVLHAGSVFVGPYSPESCGDYASGTNHTLPTYGYARQYSGVSTLSFLKHITSQELTLEGLRALGPVVETLATAEGLDGHRNAVTVRLETMGR